ncbi:MAG TPA: aromatic amino acid lyase, partial [Chitinophagaceae bacterium]|nr:aromatic amino acid lyase [Chitinophagaceae bacterium]
MSYNYLPLDKTVLTFQQVQNFLKYKQQVSVTFAAHEAILNCREYLDKKLANSDELFYGINTGFGFLQ